MYLTRMKELRKQNGVKQIVIAKYLHVSQSTYSAYETGVTRLIPIDTLAKIADYYDVTLDYLVNHNSKSPKDSSQKIPRNKKK